MNFYVFAICFQSIFFLFLYTFISCHFFSSSDRDQKEILASHKLSVISFNENFLYIMKVIQISSFFLFFCFCLIIFCYESRRWILYIYVYMYLYILSRFKHTFPISFACQRQVPPVLHVSHFYFAHFQTHSQFFIFSLRESILDNRQQKETNTRKNCLI